MERISFGILLCRAGDQDEGVWGRQRLNTAHTNAWRTVASRRWHRNGERKTHSGKAGGFKTTPLCTKSRGGSFTPPAVMVPHPQPTFFPWSGDVYVEGRGK